MPRVAFLCTTSANKVTGRVRGGSRKTRPRFVGKEKLRHDMRNGEGEYVQEMELLREENVAGCPDCAQTQARVGGVDNVSRGPFFGLG